MKRFVSFFLILTTFAGTLFAEKVQIGPLFYELNEYDKTAAVAYESNDANNYQYLSIAAIPSSIQYNAVTYSVTSIKDSAFYHCLDMTSVEIPNSVIRIGKAAFRYCSGLTSIEIPSSVKYIGDGAFYMAPNIDYHGTATGSPWGARYVNGYVEGWLVYADASRTTLVACSAIATGAILLPNGVTTIGENAFHSCHRMTSIEIPNSVTSIEKEAFSLCSGLTSIELPNSVTSMGDYAFEDCTGLTNIEIPNSITYIRYNTFANCSGLTRVEIPNSVTGIGFGAFQGCTGLPSIAIPNSVKSIGESAFSSVPNVEYHGTATGSPWGARSVNGYVEGWLVYADHSKSTLLACSTAATGELSLPNSVTSIGNSAFCWCDGLTSIEIPNSVISIGEFAFTGCDSLTSVTIPNSVTSIGDWAFTGCYSLTSVTIPNSVTSIGDWAFAWSFKLTNVTNYAATPQSITLEVFDGVDLLACKLSVIEESVSLYQAANVWKDFGTIIGVKAPEAIDSPTANEQPHSVHKILRDGQVLIHRGDNTYTLTGQITF